MFCRQYVLWNIFSKSFYNTVLICLCFNIMICQIRFYLRYWYWKFILNFPVGTLFRVLISAGVIYFYLQFLAWFFWSVCKFIKCYNLFCIIDLARVLAFNLKIIGMYYLWHFHRIVNLVNVISISHFSILDLNEALVLPFQSLLFLFWCYM